MKARKTLGVSRRKTSWIDGSYGLNMDVVNAARFIPSASRKKLYMEMGEIEKVTSDGEPRVVAVKVRMSMSWEFALKFLVEMNAAIDRLRLGLPR